MSTTDLSVGLITEGLQVLLHSHLFPGEGEKPDHEWIPIVTQRGYAILTSDKKMKSWKTEQMQARQAIEDNAAKVFFLRGVGLKPADQAMAVIKAERSMSRACQKYRGTYLIARIHSANGPNVGQLHIQYYGEGTRTEQRYGTRLNRETLA